MPITLRWTAIVFLLIGLSACSGGGSSSSNGNRSTSTGGFSIEPIAALVLTEGDAAGVNIPVNITRDDGHTNNISIVATGLQDSDNRFMAFTPGTLNNGQSASSINARLDIDDLPIMDQQRTLTVTASDGTDTATTQVLINVKPVNAPDVYLLIGQSNMVGFSGDGTKFSGAGEPDEPNDRILQLNVTKNNQDNVFFDQATFTSVASNVIESSRIVRAEDPLHEPLDPNNSSSKNLSFIGLGLSFAKSALNNTTQNVVLVPAAWSGSSFCVNDGGPLGQWNAQLTADGDLGNTWLYDRAVTRANIALQETGGILRGILWHQGESDANDRCADTYAANLERLAQQLRLGIDEDRRGGALRRGDSNIPFVAGTMSRGIDDRGDLSFFWDAKQKVDNAHHDLPSRIAHAGIAVNDDLTPDNGFPCGNTTCIHFGAAALREMGNRYYQSLISASQSQNASQNQ